ncbi:MAG: hypothetical protein U0736_27905 [Gemmataceae bacterium]
MPAKLAGATYGLLAGGFIAAVIAAFTLIFTFARHGPFWLAPVLFFAPFGIHRRDEDRRALACSSG